jgi:hypothetical protein
VVLNQARGDVQTGSTRSRAPRANGGVKGDLDPCRLGGWVFGGVQLCSFLTHQAGLVLSKKMEYIRRRWLFYQVTQVYEWLLLMHLYINQAFAFALLNTIIGLLVY